MRQNALDMYLSLLQSELTETGDLSNIKAATVETFDNAESLDAFSEFFFSMYK